MNNASAIVLNDSSTWHFQPIYHFEHWGTQIPVHSYKSISEVNSHAAALIKDQEM